jgi:hypothetical protein
LHPRLLAWAASTGADLLVYPVVISRHAVHADTARTLSRPRLLSGQLLAAFILGTRTGLSGSIPFDAHLMWFIFITAYLFNQCPAVRPRLAAAARTLFSAVNSLIRRVGLSPTLTPASPAHVPKGRGNCLLQQNDREESPEEHASYTRAGAENFKFKNKRTFYYKTRFPRPSGTQLIGRRTRDWRPWLPSSAPAGADSVPSGTEDGWECH